jgi:DNA-binding CsgD family transcriptional regulator
LNHLDAEVTNGLVAIAGMSGFKGRLMILAHDSYGSAAAFPGDGASRYSVFPTERRFAELVTAIKTACPSRPAPPPSEEMAPESSLSRQEQRAAELVAEGLANKEIGARMGISESAVKALLQRIFLKMRVRSRGQVIRMLVERSCRVH